MHRIDTNVSATLPTPAAAGTAGYFLEGGAGVVGTQVHADWCNAVQEELIGILTGAGISPNKIAAGVLVTNQLIQAVRRLGSANSSVFTASGTLTADNAGLVFVDATTANVVLTLPLSSSAGGAPFHFEIVRTDSAAAHSVTTVFSGSDAFVISGPSSVAVGQIMSIGASGSGTWCSWFENSPASLVAAGGWERRPSGMIEQWGQGAIGGASAAVTFPMAFPTACAGVLANERHASGGWATGIGSLYGPSDATVTGFTMYAWVVSSAGALSAPTSGAPIAYFYTAKGW